MLVPVAPRIAMNSNDMKKVCAREYYKPWMTTKMKQKSNWITTEEACRYDQAAEEKSRLQEWIYKESHSPQRGADQSHNIEWQESG
jgi:hypothetical protein